jgi:hypothetical protein
MYTSVTVIQQKIGRVLTADEASLFDAVVGPAIDEWINNYLGFSFNDDNGAVTIHRDGGSSAVYVGPLASITKIEYVGPDTAVDAGDEWATTDYYFENGWLFSYSRKPFVKGVRNIRVTGTFADIPASIRLAATMLAAKPLQHKGAREVDSEKIGDYQVTYSNLSTQANVAQLIDDSILALLAPFKPIRVA